MTDEFSKYGPILIAGDGFFRLSRPVVILFSEFLSIPAIRLEMIRIRHRFFGIELPWLGLRSRGGGIVLGNSIFFTHHYFDTSAKHDLHRFTDEWLDILSHELVHIRQQHDVGNSPLFYARIFWQYLSGLSYRKSKYEIEAENERIRFRSWMRQKGAQPGKELRELLCSGLDADEKERQLGLILQAYPTL